MAGEVLSDPVINEATQALQAGGAVANPNNVGDIVEANKELLTLHELIAHRLFQILIGQHRDRTFSA
jgi:xylose isomerase